MKINRCIGVLLLAATALLLSGCQLAQEIAAPEEARMIGVFITSHHLDLLDRSLEGQPIPMRRGQPDFSALFQPGRLYAQWNEEIGDFRFPDIEGIPLFAAMSPPHVPNETTISHVGPGISGGHTHMFYGDDYTRVEMEGTVYIVPGAQAMAVVHMNPVFQTTDGYVFLTTGNAFSGHGLATEGRVFSTSMAETVTINENGAERTSSISVTLNVSGMFAPTEIVLLQMDEYSQIVARAAFLPGEMPRTFYTEAETAYIIVETHRDTADAHDRVTRELIAQERHGQRISTFFARGDGVLEKIWTEIIWDTELR